MNQRSTKQRTIHLKITILSPLEPDNVFELSKYMNNLKFSQPL